MAYARYNVIEGEVMSFEQNGVRRDLFPDPQGSVAYHITNFHLTSASTTYWPYGRIRSRTGSVDIPFLYLGTHGYYRDMKSFNDLVYGRYYVRARFYSQNLGQWTTQDPLWPQEHAYQYVNGNPINYVDPGGNQSKNKQCDGPNYDASKWPLKLTLNGPNCLGYVYDVHTYLEPEGWSKANEPISLCPLRFPKITCSILKDMMLKNNNIIPLPSSGKCPPPNPTK